MKITRLLILLLLLPLSGCASVSLVKSWQAQRPPAKSFQNILVVGISGDRQMRQVFEEVLTAELRKKGISAVPSYTITGVDEAPSRSSIEKAVGTTHTDAVIATRLARMNQKQEKDVGYVMTDHGRVGPISYATFDMKPVEITTSRTYVLETNLFDTKTQDLVWSGTTNAVDPQGIITLSEKYSALVSKTLEKEGLIR
jgi:hypothetical protein